MNPVPSSSLHTSRAAGVSQAPAVCWVCEEYRAISAGPQRLKGLTVEGERRGREQGELELGK